MVIRLLDGGGVLQRCLDDDLLDGVWCVVRPCRALVSRDIGRAVSFEGRRRRAFGLCDRSLAGLVAQGRKADVALGRILLAVESEDVRPLVEFIVTGAGHRVETAVDGVEALRCYRGGGFDLLCLDHEMLRLGGSSLRRRCARNTETGFLS